MKLNKSIKNLGMTREGHPQAQDDLERGRPGLLKSNFRPSPGHSSFHFMLE